MKTAILAGVGGAAPAPRSSNRGLMGLRSCALVLALALTPAAAMAQTSFNATGVGPIPDAPIAGCGQAVGTLTPLNTTFAVSALTGTLSDLDVSITFAPAHTWGGDVTAILIAPGGTPTFPLFGRIGATTATGCGTANDLGGPYLLTDPANSANNMWTAAAASPIPAGTYQTSPVGDAGVVNPPAGTAFRAAFLGLTAAQMNGNWTLRFLDSGGGDLGTVSAAVLRITTAAPPAPLTTVPASGTTVAMPQQTVGGAATTRSIVFTNPGAAAVTVTCVAPAATQFTVSPLSFSVPAGGTGSTTITYTSATTGSFVGTLNCSTPAPQAFTYALTGTTASPTAVSVFHGPGLWVTMLGIFGLGLLVAGARRR